MTRGNLINLATQIGYLAKENNYNKAISLLKVLTPMEAIFVFNEAKKGMSEEKLNTLAEMAFKESQKVT